MTLVFAVGVATGIATTPAPLAAQDGPPRAPSERPALANSLATWYGLGMGAHHLCAGLWVVGRDHARTPEAVVAEDLAPRSTRGTRGARSFPRERAMSSSCRFPSHPCSRIPMTRSGVIAYRGHIIGERYVGGWGPYTPQLSWSAGKSIVSALVGVLVQQGELALEQPAPVEAWQGERDPRRRITIADLLRMSSGLDFDNFGLNPGTSYTAANEHFRIYFDALDVAAHSIHQPLQADGHRIPMVPAPPDPLQRTVQKCMPITAARCPSRCIGDSPGGTADPPAQPTAAAQAPAIGSRGKPGNVTRVLPWGLAWHISVAQRGQSYTARPEQCAV